MCERISIPDVCSVLCQAHLYDAKQLEDVCLQYIQKNLAAVTVTPMFGTISKEWPEVMFKISIFTAGVSEASAVAAIEAQRLCGKRKRED